MNMISYLLCATACLTPMVDAATPFVHTWDAVKNMMSLHGAFGTTLPTESDIQFVAGHYATATLTGGCEHHYNKGDPTMEDVTLSVASRVKAVNPSIKMGMYWRTDFAMEIATCSRFSEQWNAHPEFRLKDDNGNYIMRGADYLIDYTNKEAATFFAHVLVNVSSWKLPSGKPILDYIYLDGDPGEAAYERFAPNMSSARSAALVDGYYAMYADLQRQLDAAGYEQKIVMNGMDDVWSAQKHVATGGAASMFDHFSILQFLESDTGNFNATLMDQAFELITSDLLANVSVKIKGWPGPIIHQRDQYPPNMHTPTTPAELQKVALTRFNSELALFLLVANEYDFWTYSWFWSIYDYIPGSNVSTVPVEFFPQAKCRVGQPLGKYERIEGTWTYKRSFTNASVFVDLTDRMASRVNFTSCKT